MTTFSLSEQLIFDKKLRKRVDVFHLALLDCAGDTLLPELYEVIGEDRFLEFIERFSGTSIRVPKESDIRNAARNADIYIRVQQGEPLDSLAKKNGMKTEEVVEIDRRLRSMLRDR